MLIFFQLFSIILILATSNQKANIGWIRWILFDKCI